MSLGTGEGRVKHADIEEPLPGLRVPLGKVLHHVSLGEPLTVNGNSEIVEYDGLRDFVDRTLTLSGRRRDLVIRLSASWLP